MHPMYHSDSASQWLGLSIDHFAEGEATVSTTLRPEMMNGFKMAHGGFIFAIADSAFAFACNPADGDGSSQTVAAGVDINFLAPSFTGDRITAVARRRASAGRSGIYDVQVFRSAEDPFQDQNTELNPEQSRELIAEFRGRSRTISVKNPGVIQPPADS